MKGYAGKVLMVDLTRSKIEQKPLEVPALEKFIGGMGMNLKLMQEYARPCTGALAPENVVVLGSGPLVGAPVPAASKLFATTKFPLNGCIGTAAAGMNFGVMLKRAGFDHVVITGSSEKPVVLVINDETVELKDARDLWGQDIARTTQVLRNGLGGKKGSIMAIGPAGEKGVAFSMMLVDNVASLGKGGLATVFGSKNLKGVVASGRRGLEIADGKRLKELTGPILSAIRNSPKREKIKKLGSMAGWEHWSEVTGIPYKDWTEIFPRGPLREKFGTEAYLKGVDTKRIGCPSCPLPCKEDFRFQDEENREAHTFASSFIGRVTSFGVRGGVETIREMLICHDLCNRLGLDTYSAGSAIDYVVTLYEDGRLDERVAGFPLKRNFETTTRLIRQIANREGIGDLLADGVSQMGRHLGREFEAQIKGETARMQAFGEEVKAYTAIVDASKIRSDIDIARLRAQLDEAAQHIKVFEVQMEAYKTDISAQAQTIDAKVKVYGSQVQGASAEAGAISEAYRLDVARENLEFKRNVENAKIAIEKAKISMESLLASAKIRVDAAGHGSDMYKAFAAGSVNSINTLTSLISNA